MAAGCKYKLAVLGFVIPAQASYKLLASTKLRTYLTIKKKDFKMEYLKKLLGYQKWPDQVFQASGLFIAIAT